MRCLGNKFGRLFENGLQRIVWYAGAGNYKKKPVDQNRLTGFCAVRRVAGYNCDGRLSAAIKGGRYGIFKIMYFCS